MKGAMILFLAICVISITANTNGSIIDPRIVGGKEANEGQFPYQAVLRTRLTRQYFCGASIISKRFLLTASHCMEGLYSMPRFVLAVVGALHRHHDGLTMKVDKIIKHKKWNRHTLLNDISMVRTAEEIIFSKSVQPIALPKHDSNGNERVILSGWGRISFPNLDPVEPLQYAEAHIISYENCRELYKRDENLFYLKKTMLCALEKEGVGTCHGDSGSPLVDITHPKNKALVGIVSWGIPCATGMPDVFTRVFSYVNWIKENIAINSVD